MADIRVLVACGAGVATSTVIAERVRDLIREAGHNPKVEQVKVVEVAKRAADYDLVVASTQPPKGLTTPFVSAVGYLTGIGEEALDDKIRDIVRGIAGEG